MQRLLRAHIFPWSRPGSGSFPDCRALLALFFLAPLLAPDAARADQFHDFNILVGGRAVGLGGAFTGLADDSSGVIYNPGGIAFAREAEVSGSVNTRYQRRIIHENVFNEEDFVEHSAGTVSSFFGLLKRLDFLSRNLTFAFAVYTPDAELQDQNTHIENNPDFKIVRFHRAQNVRASTFHAGGVFALRLGDSVGLGFGGSYLAVDELVQSYQDSRLGPYTLAENPEIPVYSNLTRNIRSRLQLAGLEPVVGLRVNFGKTFSLGAAYKRTLFLSQKFEFDLEQSVVQTREDNTVLTPAEFGGSADSGVSGKLEREQPDSAAFDSVFTQVPQKFRFGLAWYPKDVFLWTADVVHATAVAGRIEGLVNYSRGATTNFATGFQWKPLAAIALRLGAFTNYDVAPEVDGTRLLHRGEYIDYHGVSLFTSYLRKNSEYSVGVVAQQGSGRAIKVPGNVNDATGQIFLFAFSISNSI